MKPEGCCVLNGGGGAWAFAGLARQLSNALWVDGSEMPREYNYLLFSDTPAQAIQGEPFIPIQSMRVAADKRLLAEVFASARVPTPETHLVASLTEAEQLVADDQRTWCLKFPTACGASGHRMYVPGMTLPKSWPFPLVLQEFIQLEQPEVYRTYGAGGQTFGWVARRFPVGTQASPWVAHARGRGTNSLGSHPTRRWLLRPQRWKQWACSVRSVASICSADRTGSGWSWRSALMDCSTTSIAILVSRI